MEQPVPNSIPWPKVRRSLVAARYPPGWSGGDCRNADRERSAPV